MATLRWEQTRIMDRLSLVMLARGQRAAAAVEAQVKERVSRPYPPPSRPGQPPHRRTGALERSVRGQATALGSKTRVTLTVAAPYAIMLQRGTRRMAKRPFAGLPADARLVVDILSGRR